MTFLLLVYAKDSLIISIDGGGFLDVGNIEPGKDQAPETSRRYLTNQVKFFSIDYPFWPVVIMSGSYWAGDPDRPDRLRSIESRIPELKEHLRLKTITNLEQFSEALIEFAEIDLWGLNGTWIDFFISGLIKTGGGYRSATLSVKYSKGIASIPTRVEFGLDRRIQDQTFIHWTFPVSDDHKKYLPDLDLMTRFIFYPWNPKNWETSYGSIIKDLQIYRGYIEPYLRKVHSPVIPPPLPSFQEALFF